MSNNINNGGPAFPIPLNPGQTYTEHGTCDGMTLRDYFASKALPVVATGCHCFGQSFLHQDYYASAALDAYKLADAMLRARGEA